MLNHQVSSWERHECMVNVLVLRRLLMQNPIAQQIAMIMRRRRMLARMMAAIDPADSQTVTKDE